MRKFQIRIGDGEVRAIAPDMAGGTTSLSLEDGSSITLDNRTVERMLACWEAERRLVPVSKDVFTECSRCHQKTVDGDGTCLVCDD